MKVMVRVEKQKYSCSTVSVTAADFSLKYYIQGGPKTRPLCIFANV